MIEPTVRLVLFKEDEIDKVAEAVSTLRELGIPERHISVISGIPFSEKILGRPMNWTNITLIGLVGALAGFGAGAALSFGTPLLYPIRVGGTPYLPVPTSIVVIFELTMLGLLISTFLGVFVETISPSFGPKGYSPKVSDGFIGVLFDCPITMCERMTNAMNALGAEWADPKEEKA